MTAFSTAWESLDRANTPLPQRMRRARHVPALSFIDWVTGAGDAARVMVDWLAGGDVLIVKGLFDAGWLRVLKVKTLDWRAGRPPSFHKMVEGCPDFHRIIDLEAGRQYAFHGCKHSAYFYRWNDDPLGVWPAVTPAWRLAKTVMGLNPLAYEAFTPMNGIVDRVQIVRYPPAIGYLEPHQDPHLHQRLFFSVYMSKRGTDFHGGGFYLVGEGDRVIELEDEIDVGDACIGYATLMHGVAPCDRHKTPDWAAADGRWFLSLYSNASDETAARHTGHAVKLRLPGVLPDGLHHTDRHEDTKKHEEKQGRVNGGVAHAAR